MANEENLALAKKIDNRFVELTGSPYKKVGAGRHVHGDTIEKLAKEFKIARTTVHTYLDLFHQPSSVLRMIEQGGMWSFWQEAVRAPESIQDIVFQKVKNNEFSTGFSVRQFINEHKRMDEESKTITPHPYEKSTVIEPSATKEVLSDVNWAQYARDQFEQTGSYDPEEASKQKFGNGEIRNVRTMSAVAYNLRKEYRKKNKDIVKKDGIFYLIDRENIPPEFESVVQESQLASKTKTAVLVAREVRDEKGTRYELDIVGDFNRGMMKEALRQMMEVFI